MIAGRATALSSLLPPAWSADTLRRQINMKRDAYPHRAVLSSLLTQQYKGRELPPILRGNIDALRDGDALCVATAHQPLLFGGKLYFLYKALTTIRLAQYATEVSGGTPVVPVFVLGSEDHDFDEVRHVRVFHETLSWEEDLQGPVGRFPVEGAMPLLEELEAMVGKQAEGQELMRLLREAYQSGRTFAEATFDLLYQLLGHLGLVVVDMDRAEAKQAFLPVMEAELLTSFSQALVHQRAMQLNEAGLKTQAHAREINLFYLGNNRRERIERGPSDDFRLVDGTQSWTQHSMMEELRLHPERFSPNVILRPLLQEMILPNLAYVGGGGELAYWLELPLVFGAMALPFPMLVRRHSVLLVDDISRSRLDKLDLTIPELFSPLDELLREVALHMSSEPLDLSGARQSIDALLEPVRAQSIRIDPNLERSFEATLANIHKQLEVLESKMVRGLKQQHEQQLQQVRNLYQRLMPDGHPQERVESVVNWVGRYGRDWIDALLAHMDPHGAEMLVVEMPLSGGVGK
jgi:bacillithiol biosynthesis cysteine-adding enzyme BshC